VLDPYVPIFVGDEIMLAGLAEEKRGSSQLVRERRRQFLDNMGWHFPVQRIAYNAGGSKPQMVFVWMARCKGGGAMQFLLAHAPYIHTCPTKIPTQSLRSILGGPRAGAGC
jgi:hypothetical protein